MSLSYRLRIKLPNGRQRTITLKKKSVTIGRDSSCDIKINDPEISRRHACLTISTEHQITISDLGSSNGTYLRNSPITQETRISPGTIIRMGNSYLSVETKGGLTTEAVVVDVSENEYQNVATLLKASRKETDQIPHDIFEFFNDLSVSNAGIRNLDHLLNRIADLLNAENGLIVLDQTCGIAERAMKITRDDKLVFPQNILDHIQQKGRSFVFPSYAMSSDKNPLTEKGTGSAICAPITDETSTLGTIYLDRSPKKQLFSTEDLRLLCYLAKLAGQSIQRELEIRDLDRKIQGLESERKRWFHALETKGEPPTPTQSRKFQQLLFVSMRIGRSDRNVLLIGHQGSGRNLIAQRIHAYSDRKNEPFITMDCVSPPRHMLKEMLFGSEEKEKVSSGLLAQAHGGSLFIREISALPWDLQEQLVEWLRTKTSSKMTESQNVATPFRLILATDVNPETTTSQQAIHPELLEISNPTSIEVPSLAERPEDILPMAKHFLRMYLPSNRTVMSFAPETAELLIRYSWPGNVTELKDCMRFIASVCAEEEVRIGDLPQRLREQPAPAVPDNLNLREQMDQLETNLIRIALDRNKNIVTRAATALGLSESTLRYRMQRLNLQ